MVGGSTRVEGQQGRDSGPELVQDSTATDSVARTASIEKKLKKKTTVATGQARQLHAALPPGCPCLRAVAAQTRSGGWPCQKQRQTRVRAGGTRLTRPLWQCPVAPARRAASSETIASSANYGAPCEHARVHKTRKFTAAPQKQNSQASVKPPRVVKLSRFAVYCTS